MRSGGPAGPADLPAGEGERLAVAGDRDRPLGHAGQGGQGDVGAPVVDEVLVDLVGDGEEIPLDADPGDGLELLAAEDPAGRVVRGVEQDQPGLRGDGGGQGVGVEGEVGGPQGDDPPLRAGHGDRGGVGVVVGLHHDDLVARLAQPEDRSGDGLGRSHGDDDLGVGVVDEAVAAELVLGHRLAEDGQARAGRVLVLPAPDGGHRRLGDLRRPVDVGEALAEVDRPGAGGQERHLVEDRGGERLEVRPHGSPHEPGA